MVTIKKAAELTGVPEHTLRAWERRYGLVDPSRTEGGYRTYDLRALDTIRTMKGLVDTGWTARDAAVESTRRALPAAAPASDDLVPAAMALDADNVARILDEQFALASFETVVDDWLMPALFRLGQAWARGEVSVAGEHLVSNVVMRRLAHAYDAAGRGTAGRPVLIGAPPDVDHQIGLLAFATAARRAGLSTIYLGGHVPADAWRHAVTTVRPRHAVSSLHRRRDADRLAPVAAELADIADLTLWVGGRHQGLAPTPWRPLGHSIADAARRLATTG
ncbi:MAG: MerR family transcriptional regulator [Actinobacteria bacterium]|nr:MerR family transcriptional regulator [Actinomycetota bacterium]